MKWMENQYKIMGVDGQSISNDGNGWKIDGKSIGRQILETSNFLAVGTICFFLIFDTFVNFRT